MDTYAIVNDMNLRGSSRTILAAIVVVAFLTITLFSFTFMMQGQDGRMQGDCPFSTMGVSVCPQDALAGAAHHISAYQSFLNVPLGSSLMLLMLALLIAFGTTLLFSIRMPFLRPALHRRHVHRRYAPITSYTRDIARWFSLLQNSPSVS